jgi:hypothetical protein
MTCQHNIIEMDNACADGMCPLCLAAKVKELTEAVATLRELRAYDRKEIEWLRHQVPARSRS